MRELQERTADLPDDFLVVLIGDLVSEEGLPTNFAVLNTYDGTRDTTGCDDTPWAVWARRWAAEERRHGDLLGKYCYLSGRINMKVRQLLIRLQFGLLVPLASRYHWRMFREALSAAACGMAGPALVIAASCFPVGLTKKVQQQCLLLGGQTGAPTGRRRWSRLSRI